MILDKQCLIQIINFSFLSFFPRQDWFALAQKWDPFTIFDDLIIIVL